MPTTLDSQTEQTARTRRPTECEPLLHAATKDLLRNNSFRITGLPLEATPRQVAKHLAKLAQMAELGLAAPHYAAVFALNPPPTLDQIRDAAQRLSDPEKRLVDELFWFWPCEPGAAVSDPALQALASGNADAALKTWATHETNPTTSAAAMHNIALFWQLTATESEPASATDPELPQQQTLEKHWRRSLDRWEYLTSDEKFWDMVNAHARRIDETRLTTGFVSRMRSTLPLALARINAELALNHAQDGRKSVARMHVQLIRDATNGAATLDKAADLVFAPTTARLRAHIDSTRKIAQESPEAAANAVRDLLAQASPTAPLSTSFTARRNTHQRISWTRWRQPASAASFPIKRRPTTTRGSSTCCKGLYPSHKRQRRAKESKRTFAPAKKTSPSQSSNHFSTSLKTW